jgi:hypothetical protein
VALLVPAMLRGEPLVIEGDIDEFLLVSLRGLVQASFRLMAPAWRRVAVEAEPRPAAATTDWTKGAATSMSVSPVGSPPKPSAVKPGAGWVQAAAKAVGHWVRGRALTSGEAPRRCSARRLLSSWASGKPAKAPAAA